MNCGGHLQLKLPPPETHCSFASKAEQTLEVPGSTAGLHVPVVLSPVLVRRLTVTLHCNLRPQLFVASTFHLWPLSVMESAIDMQGAATSAEGVASLIMPLSVFVFDVVIFDRPTSFAFWADASAGPSKKVQITTTIKLPILFALAICIFLLL